MNYVLLLLGLCLSFWVVEKEVIAQPSSDKIVTVGVYPNAPKVFIDDSNKPSGFWVDLVENIKKAENWSITYIPCEWSQCLEQVKQGKIDLMVDVAYSQQREQIFDFNKEVVLASWSQIYARRGVTLESMLDLDGKKVGILTSSIQKAVLQEQIKAFGIEPKLTDVDSYPEMFGLLEKGEIDAAIVNNFFGKKFAPDYQIVRTNVLFNPARLHFIVTKDDPKSLLSGIDRQLQILINDPNSIYYQSISQWLEPDQTFSWSNVQIILRNLLIYSPFFALVGVITWNYSLKREIARRQILENNLTESQQRYISLTNAAPVGIFRTNVHQECVYVNAYYCELLNISPQDSLNRGWLERVHPEDMEQVRQHWLKCFESHQTFALEYRFQRSDGSIVWVYGQGVPEYDSEGKIKGYVATVTDIGDRITMELQLKYDAFHDKLTGLANRHLLTERLKLAIKRDKRYSNYKFAILFFDLDNFKIVNDSLGHIIGDELLIEVSRLLKSFIRETDLAARLGGDEFVILLEGIEEIEEAVRVAERILESLKNPVIIANREVFISSSIGIILANSRHESAEDLLRDADIAMYRAKQNGKGKYAIFDPLMHETAVKRLHLEHDLRTALENQEFVLYYQPILDLQTQIIRGFEALIRWQHPTKGLLSPFEFIDIVEETGLIIPLGEWILDTACQQLSKWQEEFQQPLRVNVNLSVKQLQESLLPLLDKILARYPLLPNTLGLEITESMLIKNIEITCHLLEQIRNKSISISIDDFGTGYSCFSYLHQLPVDSLKIDRSFVRISEYNQRNRAISESIIALAKSIGIKTVAEGIENEQQLQWLKQQKCELGQGYLFSPPVSVEKATELLQASIQFLAEQQR